VCIVHTDIEDSSAGEVFTDLIRLLIPSIPRHPFADPATNGVGFGIKNNAMLTPMALTPMALETSDKFPLQKSAEQPIQVHTSSMIAFFWRALCGIVPRGEIRCSIRNMTG